MYASSYAAAGAAGHRFLAALVGLALLVLGTPGNVRASDPAAFCVSPLQFELEPKATLPEGFRGSLVLRPVGSEGEPIRLEARVGTSARTALPCSTKWEVTPEFPEAWGPRVTVESGPRGDSRVSRIALWPMGKIAGSVKLSGKGERLPKILTATTLAPRVQSAGPPPKGKMDCPVDPQGKWSCSLPAATFDLVFEAEGFGPQYRWGVRVLPGQVSEVGAVELARGATVAGWVAVEQGAIDPQSCRARLAPLVASGRMSEKMQKTVREVAVRKDGFFQLNAVTPGNYLLEVRQKGFAAGTAEVAVSPRTETFLRDPITLKRPFHLALLLSPPLDWLNERWRVEISRLPTASGGSGREVYSGVADEQGAVSVPGQEAGRFTVQVRDSRGNRLATQTLPFGPEEERKSIDIQFLTIHGTVKLGKEPLAATLWFGGHFGAQSVQLESDSAGKFHGVLPRDGWWRVDIAAATPRFEIRRRVKVDSDGHDRGTVEIALPTTHLFGKVVMDDTGRPVPSAEVGLATDEGNMSQHADDSGTFEFRGFPAGTVYAAASLFSGQGSWTSDRLTFAAGEGQDLGPVEIRLRKTRQVAGIVQSPFGPVAGASVDVVPFRPIVMFGDTVHTDLDGSFSAQVPGLTETASAVVSAPGFALRAFAVKVGEPPAPLPVSTAGGTLEVLLPEESEATRKESLSLWVFQNGLPLSLQALGEWALRHGQSSDPRKSIFPEMAPGEYRVCIVAQSVLVPWEVSGWTAPLAKCVAGQLEAGGTLRLDLSRP